VTAARGMPQQLLRRKHEEILVQKYPESRWHQPSIESIHCDNYNLRSVSSSLTLAMQVTFVNLDGMAFFSS
jgi:hypothetical protein